MTRRASPEAAGAHTLDADEARPSTAGRLPRWRCLMCSQLPRLFLCLWALHPIRRHYTPSGRVRCSLTGALPPNGCRVSRALTEACPSSADFAASRSRRCTRLRRLGVFDRDVRLGPAAPPGRCSYARCNAKSGSFLPPGAQAFRYPLSLWPSLSHAAPPLCRACLTEFPVPHHACWGMACGSRLGWGDPVTREGSRRRVGVVVVSAVLAVV